MMRYLGCFINISLARPAAAKNSSKFTAHLENAVFQFHCENEKT